MPEFEAKVSFHGMEETAVDASVSVADQHLTIDVSGRRVGRWPISELAPEAVGDAVVISAEGERLVIDVTDPDELRISLRVHETIEHVGAKDPQVGDAAPDLTSESYLTPQTASASEDRAQPSPTPDSSDAAAATLRRQLEELQTAMAAAQAQLRWVLDLMPRRLPILIRADEAGLGVVQGVRLKERRPLPGSDGLQPWVVVDSGNVYLTDRRLVFSGAQDVEFEFDEIVKKGASPTGLLLGVSSRTQTHILAGPGERLAVVLTAAEKIARGVDPTLPFREAVARLTVEIERTQQRIEQLDQDDQLTLDQSADL